MLSVFCYNQGGVLLLVRSVGWGIGFGVWLVCYWGLVLVLDMGRVSVLAIVRAE